MGRSRTGATFAAPSPSPFAPSQPVTARERAPVPPKAGEGHVCVNINKINILTPRPSSPALRPPARVRQTPSATTPLMPPPPPRRARQTGATGCDPITAFPTRPAKAIGATSRSPSRNGSSPRLSRGILLSETEPATARLSLSLPAGWNEPAHPTPKRQIRVCLKGTAKVIASDGNARRIGPGDVWRTEDTRGAGHHAKVVGAEDFEAMTIRVN